MGALSKLSQLGLLATVFPAMCLTITADRLLPGRNPLCPFPRTIDEIRTNPAQLLELIVQGGRAGIARGAVFVSFTSSEGSATEPSKNESVVKGVLSYCEPSAPGVTKRIGIFVKLPTTRKLALWVKAFGSTFGTVAKEVGFYNHAVRYFTDALQTPFPVDVPECLYASWSRFFDRTIVICRVIDTTLYRPIPDWEGLSMRQIHAQIACAAAMHGATWGGYGSGFDYLTDREGVGWIDGFVNLFIHKAPAVSRRHWEAIKRRVQHTPVCFSHGDCRGGNMLFRDTATETHVVMTDWEANSITPFMWDCTYAMVCGLTPERRREHQDAIVDAYLGHLTEALNKHRVAGTYKGSGQPDAFYSVPPRDECMKLMRVMCNVINFFGFVLGCLGNVGETQGNTSKDMLAWSVRLHCACLDAMSDTEAYAADVGIDVAAIEELRTIQNYSLTTAVKSLEAAS